jgi:hypothetical protein
MANPPSTDVASYERAGGFRAPRGRVRIDVNAEAPQIGWAQLVRYLREPDPKASGEPRPPRFRQGDHVAIIGPTGAGKTHIAFPMAEIRSHVLVVACKPQDPLVVDALGRGYYLIPGNKLEIEYVDGRPLHPRVIYWPRLSQRQTAKIPTNQLLKAEKALHKRHVGEALGYVRRDGHWCLVIDEGTYVCRDLNLQRDVDSALQQFRSLRASIIILGQRPSWMGRYVLNQPSHLFLFQTADLNDRKALGDISGFDSRAVADIVQGLDRDKHEVLYLNTRSREMFRTVAPPR